MTMHLTKGQLLDYFGDYDSGLGRGYDIRHQDIPELVRKIIAANEKKRGTITVTKDDFGVIVAVTRTDDEGKILEVIAEGTSGKEIESAALYYQWL